MPTAPAKIPNHVAIIMDGNGRWAKQRGLPRIEGHRRVEGTIVCRLFEKDAPKTVANFVELAEGKREWTTA